MENLTLIQFSGDITKPVEFLKEGTFKDSYGRVVEITSETLDNLVLNFASGEAGQDIPIDIKHEWGEAAGWIKQVWREGNKLLANIDWNDMGRDLVGKHIYRYLSASIDLKNNVLKAISLVNFPAVKGLSPIELGEYREQVDTILIESGSVESVLRAINQTFYKQFESEESYNYWIVETYEDHIIIEKESTFYRINFINNGSNIVFDPAEDWVKVLRTYEPINFNQIPEDNSMSEELKQVEEQEIAESVAEVVDEVELKEEVVEEVVEAQEKAELPDEGNYENFLATLGQSIRDEVRELIQSEINAARLAVKDQIQSELAEETQIAAFSQRITSTGNHAIPIPPAKLEKVLKGIPTANRVSVIELLQNIYDNGTVSFTELGTSEQGKKVAENYDDVTAAVQLHIQGGGTVDSFFSALPELNKNDYQLEDQNG